MKFPDGKTFAFTIFDDTDNATVENVAPVYNLLRDSGLRTTKSVWVFPPRGSYKGSSLADESYLRFIRDIQASGFEIGLHNVGDGLFSRDEITEGFERFRDLIGHYPEIHTNHVSNPDNIYWWDRRFEHPISSIYRLTGRTRRQRGIDPEDETFWGDIAKRHLRYIRNLTFNDINTLACDPRMPYRTARTSKYANRWFSSSDGHTVAEFSDLIDAANVDRLERTGGACIVYTHLASGFVYSGHVDPGFERKISALSKRNGWFVPVSTLLDYLAGQNATDADPGYAYRLKTNLRWISHRIGKKRRYRR